VLKAEIRYNNGTMSTPCLIRDISETGARLEIPGDFVLPNRFDLYIEKRNQTRRVLVKRRDGRALGVAFDDPIESVPAEAGLAGRVAKLEAGVAEVKEQLAKIMATLERSG
jgi:hypothetical protein